MAQLIYNGVQAQEVVYRNNYGEYSGVIYATENGTVLENRFHVAKVTGILEANDKVSVAGAIRSNGTLVGHSAGAVALKGESLLCVTDVSGYSRDDFGRLYDAATYKVETSDEMVGQEIVIYVKYLNDLSPNAASATVIGEPILTDNNTVVETTTRLKDDAAVRSALRAGGMTNIGTPRCLPVHRDRRADRRGFRYHRFHHQPDPHQPHLTLRLPAPPVSSSASSTTTATAIPTTLFRSPPCCPLSTP